MHAHFSEHERGGHGGRGGGRGRGGGHGGGRHRARRGAVQAAVLTLLDERPMHGYEIINELDTRSDGRWRPSPGAVYPALEKMEEAGAVTATEVDGKRRFELTDSGREMLIGIREKFGDEAPWKMGPGGGRGDLRRLMAELGGQVRQIGRFGSGDQRDAATAVLEDAKRKLYEILARPAADVSEDGDTDDALANDAADGDT